MSITTNFFDEISLPDASGSGRRIVAKISNGVLSSDPSEVPTSPAINAALAGLVTATGNPFNAVTVSLVAGTTTSNKNANVSAWNSAVAAIQDGQILVVINGAWRFNANLVASSTTKKFVIWILGDCTFDAGFGFRLSGNFHNFSSFGVLDGSNTGGNNATTYAAYTGAALELQNTDKCKVYVNRILNFNKGVWFHGLNGGCQYTSVEFGQVRACYICFHGTAEGSTGWCNSNYIIGRPGQIGGGTSGPAGATYGIRLENGPGNTGELNYWDIRDVGFEGVENGIWASSLRYSWFDGMRFEFNAVVNRIFLKEDNSAGQMCYHNMFLNTALYDFYFVSGGRGINTQCLCPVFTSSGTTVGQFVLGNGSKMIAFDGDESVSHTTETVIDSMVFGGFNTTNYQERYMAWVRRIMGGVNVSAGVPLELGQKTVTGNYTLENQYDSFWVTGAAAVLTFPAAASWVRRKVKIVNKTAGNITASGVASGGTIPTGVTRWFEAYNNGSTTTWEPEL
jgi:hypothetical protein